MIPQIVLLAEDLCAILFLSNQLSTYWMMKQDMIKKKKKKTHSETEIETQAISMDQNII